jgi:hypothetical protein
VKPSLWFHGFFVERDDIFCLDPRRTERKVNMDLLVKAGFLLGVASGAFAVVFQGLRNVGLAARWSNAVGFELHVTPHDFLVFASMLFLLSLAADTYNRYATGVKAR